MQPDYHQLNRDVNNMFTFFKTVHGRRPKDADEFIQFIIYLREKMHLN
jgi:hypothetical protein